MAAISCRIRSLATLLSSCLPIGNARMRYWNKFVDEHVMNHVSMHGWHRLVGVIARNIDEGTFEELLSHIPLPDQRKKWATARSGRSRWSRHRTVWLREPRTG